MNDNIKFLFLVALPFGFIAGATIYVVAYNVYCLLTP